jgi:hypothetical protein
MNGISREALASNIFAGGSPLNLLRACTNEASFAENLQPSLLSLHIAHSPSNYTR